MHMFGNLSRNIAVAIATLFLAIVGYAQAKKEPRVDEILTPLTKEEAALNPGAIITNQPDFVADLTFFVAEGFGGHGGAERLVWKGKRYRRESQFWIFVGELGKPAARLFPHSKTYNEFEASREGSADSTPLNPQALAEEDGTTFTSLGAVVIDGHRCLKIQATRKGKPEKIFLYAARDLKNLVIVAQVIEPRRSMGQKLSNISLEVPSSLVEIPPDYKPVEHDRWLKVENATLTYKGKPSKDFGVFRGPGGELFIWVNDAPYPWFYLIRPREGIRETAFQGLLVTRDGEYIWQTKDTEAFSLTAYRVPQPSKWEKPEEVHVVVTSNSAKFRSIDFQKHKAMIEVRW
jgi:hypothetical protein